MSRGRSFGLALVLAITVGCAAAYGRTAPPPAQSHPAGNSKSETPSPPQTTASSSSSQPHAIAVTFDYDFGATPACTSKVTQKCVKQFVIYDISAGADMPYKIGTVPLPDNPVGKKQGITGKSDPSVFEPGKHLIAVSAQGPEPASSSQSGKQPESGPQSKPIESPPAACTTWVTIP